MASAGCRRSKAINPKNKIRGSPCDLRATVEAAQTEGLFSSGGAQASSKESPAAWLLQWAASHAVRFEIVAALKARRRVKLKRINGAKQVLECPFEDEHTTPGGKGTFAVNASQLAAAELPQISSGFVLKCSHNACCNAKSPREFRKPNGVWRSTTQASFSTGGEALPSGSAGRTAICSARPLRSWVAPAACFGSRRGGCFRGPHLAAVGEGYVVFDRTTGQHWQNIYPKIVH
jgi:hypothetical protein